MNVCILATGAGAEGEAVLFQARELETRQAVISTVRRNARGGRRRDLTRSISWPARAPAFAHARLLLTFAVAHSYESYHLLSLSSKDYPLIPN